MRTAPRWLLLIIAAPGRAQLAELVAQAREVGLTPRVEAHDEAEAERAVAAGTTAIGVNVRDLTMLEVDRGIFARVAPPIPEGPGADRRVGVRSPEEVTAHAHADADAVLLDEALVSYGDPRRICGADH